MVECSTFDELAADIIKEVDLPLPLLNMVTQGRPTPRLVSNVNAPFVRACTSLTLRREAEANAAPPQRASQVRGRGAGSRPVSKVATAITKMPSNCMPSIRVPKYAQSMPTATAG